MTEAALKEDYYNKQEFIRDFIMFCRYHKKKWENSTRMMPRYINKFVGVCGESWSFQVYIEKGGDVCTSATLYNKGEIHYPKTKWGEPDTRWDSELRSFLNREIEKDGKNEQESRVQHLRYVAEQQHQEL